MLLRSWLSGAAFRFMWGVIRRLYRDNGKWKLLFRVEG